MLKLQELTIGEKTNWFSKLAHMEEEEIQLLPSGFLKKYGSYLNFMQKQQAIAKLDENKVYMGYYDQIKKLDKLKTN
jgi:hypothetical protein